MFFVVTLLIVIFVESLVIRAKIVREWRSMGISKALGVTSRGLIAEIMLSNLPAIALGTVIGAVLSRPAGVGFMKGILAMFGIKKIEYGISIPAILLSVGAILLVALITSGLETRRFCFEAFLPSEKKERDAVLEELQQETRTIVLYEAPHRLKKTLDLLLEQLGDRPMTICRELTKKHEEIRRTTLAEAAAWYEANEPRGEFALVIAGQDRRDLIRRKQEEVRTSISLADHMEQYLAEGMDRKEAMKAVARDRGLSKRDVYRLLLDETK